MAVSEVRVGAIEDRLGAIDLEALKQLVVATEGTVKLIEEECEEDKAFFEKAKAARENERAIIEELLTHFETNVVTTT